MFSKRHYEAIAEVFRVTEPHRPEKMIPGDPQRARFCHHHIVIQEFADMFQRDNPRFDSDRFIIACTARRRSE